MTPRSGRRILLLVDRAVDDLDAMPGLARWLVAEAADRVTVIAPRLVSRAAFWTGDTAKEERVAQQRVDEMVGRLHNAGIAADGAVGGEDPVDSVVVASAHETYDAIVVLGPAPGGERWNEHDLEARVRERVGVPVVHVSVGPGGELDASPTDGLPPAPEG